MIESIATYRQTFLDHLAQIEFPESPRELYSPIEYILDIGGKRIRPVLVLLSADLYGAEPKRAFPPRQLLKFSTTSP